MIEDKIIKTEPSHIYISYASDDKCFLVFGGKLYSRYHKEGVYYLLKEDYVELNKKLYKEGLIK